MDNGELIIENWNQLVNSVANKKKDEIKWSAFARREKLRIENG